jgi:hypothetical protein
LRTLRVVGHGVGQPWVGIGYGLGAGLYTGRGAHRVCVSCGGCFSGWDETISHWSWGAGGIGICVWDVAACGGCGGDGSRADFEED